MMRDEPEPLPASELALVSGEGPSAGPHPGSTWRCRKCCAWFDFNYRYPPSPWVYCEECGRALDDDEQRVAVLRLELELRSTLASPVPVIAANQGIDRKATLPHDESKDPDPPTRELITVPEVARLLGKSEKAVYALARRGNLPGAIKVGRSLMVRRADLLSSSTEGRVPSRRKRR